MRQLNVMSLYLYIDIEVGPSWILRINLSWTLEAMHQEERNTKPDAAVHVTSGL